MPTSAKGLPNFNPMSAPNLPEETRRAVAAAFGEMSAVHEGWIDQLLGGLTAREAERLSGKLKCFRSDWESKT